MRRSLLCFALALSWGCSEEPLPSSPPPGDTDAGTAGCGEGAPCPSGFACRSGVCEAEAPDAGPQGRGQVQVTPEALDFGAFQLGATVQLTLTVENIGDADLELLSLEIEDNASGELRLDTGGTLPKTLPPGEPHYARILYTATDGQDDNDRLRVITNDRERPVVIVPLTAEYKGQSEIAVVRDAASAGPEVPTLDFGSIPIGGFSEATVFIKNVGTGNAVLRVDSVRTDPNPSLVYEVQTSTGVPVLLGKFRPEALCSNGQCDLPETTCVDGLCLDASGAPPDTVAVTVTFRPGRAGAVEELLIISNDDGDGDERAYQIRLVGEGIQASLLVQPDPIDLGTVFVGFPRQLPVSLQSVGDDRLTVLDVALVGAPAGLAVTVTSTLPWTLSPGEAVTATLTADPVAPGTVSGMLRVESSDLDLPVREVPLRGEVLIAPAIVTSSAAVTFGEVHVFRAAGQRVDRVITVDNVGGSPLIISAIGLAPGSSADFAVTPTAGGPLNPGESLELTVSYRPTVIGPDTGVLAIATNDPARPRLDIPLSGEGTDPTLFLFKSTVPPIPASPIDFGPVYRGSSAPAVTLTIQNVGVGTLVVEGLALSAGSSPDFLLMNLPGLPAAVASGGTVTLDVSFAPASVGLDTGAIDILTNDRDGPLTVVNLSGEGVGCAANRWDLDNDPANGCEYVCTQASPPVERCNGADDDCNGAQDEGFSLGAVCDGVGQCGGGVIECTPDGSSSTCSTNPGQSQSEVATEICNTLDDNCDGVPDDGFNLQADLANCGSCGTVCATANGTPVCATGACAIASCNPNFDDCNNQYADGCEASLLVDLANCGTCNTACAVANGSPVCSSGTCAISGCNPGFFDCNTSYTDGCEADLQNSVTTCGSCSTQCAVANGSPTCSSGSCGIASCVAPWRDCNTQYVDGCETNSASSILHCGACGSPCSVANGAPGCTSGSCNVASCTAPFADCNTQYADGCEANLSNSVTTCGACNTTCTVANGAPGCTSGNCNVASCTAPFADCNTQYADGCETNLSNNLLSCGFCGNVCAVANGAPTCAGGGCAVASCTNPWRDCNNQYADGCEANTGSSLQHCGGCNLGCAVANGTPTCNSGSCQIQSCTAPFADCNLGPADGCEVNTSADTLHCGFCGNACNLANATPACSGGACAIAQCTAPFADCNTVASDGCEADLFNSLATCGGCNSPCDFANASETCNNGVCTFGGCQTGFVDLDGNVNNGCEYQCTPSAGVDLPDGSLIDRDCDGIDGDLDAAIFVSPLGSDLNTGLFGSPVRSIGTALTRAGQRGFVQVLVAGGFYNERVDMADGVGLYAGYDPLNWSNRSYSTATVISGGALGSNLFGVRAENLILSTRLDGFSITVGNNNQASGSVYGVYARNVGSNLVLSNLTVSTGRGGDGTPGTGGSPGQPGGNGGGGQAGCDGCSGNGFGGSAGSSSCGRPGGSGGRGGHDNASGSGGATATAGGGGGGGGLGAQVCDSSGCSSCGGRKGGRNGTSGSTGGFGTSGNPGAGGLAAGAVIGNLWAPGTGVNGTNGTPGAGGGGGGGGGGGADDCYANLFFCVDSGNICNADRGGGGGGGGAGGCGGTAGTAGGGGGGSFGVFLVSASPRIESCTIAAGRGGDGGAGAGGGGGGSGGSAGGGGTGLDDGGNGAGGASGRPGGNGGAGGGGAGGASYGVYRGPGSSPALTGNTLSATGGATGGGGPGNGGQGGLSNGLF